MSNISAIDWGRGASDAFLSLKPFYLFL